MPHSAIAPGDEPAWYRREVTAEDPKLVRVSFGLEGGDEELSPEGSAPIGAATDPLEWYAALAGGTAVRRIRLMMVQGPEAGRTWDSTSDTCSIGSHELNNVVIAHPTVSRFHCELKIDARGVRIRDLGSRNGTIVDGVLVMDAFLRGGSVLQLGRVTLRLELGNESNVLPLSTRSRFGSLVSTSTAMRGCFALMERAASSDATILIEGETGTGKGHAAMAIHNESSRAGHPFMLVDCGAIPANLLESELFGHEKGSFTGAQTRRIGAFEQGSGGTIFLDEIGELPAELQPKLLRVLEERVIRRIGLNIHTPVDIRIIAATNRDLRAEVNAGRFRSDLYFRLAVVKIVIPPLRQRPEDIPIIVEAILESLRAGPELMEALRTPAFLGNLQRAAWPGNVRELRNHIERCIVFQSALSPGDVTAEAPPMAVDASVPYPEARRRALDAFERAYLQDLMRLHDGKVTQAAAKAEIDRVYLHRLLRRHSLKP
jgi:two-component system, NtrC family, response regulator GlrR